MTRNVRIPGRIPDGPARRSDGVSITAAVQVNERGSESPQQSDNEEEDEEDDDGNPSYLLLYDPIPGDLNLAHAIEEAREEGDGGNSDEEGDEVLLHDDSRLEVEQDL
jgi:hypothetical protein